MPVGLFLNPLPVVRRRKARTTNPTWKWTRGVRSVAAFKARVSRGRRAGVRRRAAHGAGLSAAAKRYGAYMAPKPVKHRRARKGVNHVGRQKMLLANPNFVLLKRRKSKKAWRRAYVAGMKAAGRMHNPSKRRRRSVRRAANARQVAPVVRHGRRRAKRKETVVARKRRTSRRHNARRVSRRRNVVRRRRHNPARRSAKRHNSLFGGFGSLGLGALAGNPRKRRRNAKRRRHNPCRRRGGRRNPLNVMPLVKGMVSKAALKDYGYLSLGVVAGGVLPGLIRRVIPGLSASSGMLVRVLLGLGGATIAKMVTKMVTKSEEKARLVAGGAVAGLAGSLALSAIATKFPDIATAGLGAEDPVRRAVDAAISRELGLGEYVGPAEAESAAAGLGEYTSPDVLESAPAVSGMLGMGMDTEEDIEEAEDFDGGDF